MEIISNVEQFQDAVIRLQNNISDNLFIINTEEIYFTNIIIKIFKDKTDLELKSFNEYILYGHETKFENLLSDLRSMKLSYYNEDKVQKFENKNYFAALKQNFKKNSRNNYVISTNFYIISGWKDHHSQQKPLKPGQAKNNLKEFFK